MSQFQPTHLNKYLILDVQSASKPIPSKAVTKQVVKASKSTLIVFYYMD